MRRLHNAIVNLLPLLSKKKKKRIKHLLRYLKGTIDLGLFYKYKNDAPYTLTGFADAGYIYDHRKERSQTGYVHLWRRNSFLEISQTNLCCSIIKPCKDLCHT